MTFIGEPDQTEVDKKPGNSLTLSTNKRRMDINSQPLTLMTTASPLRPQDPDQNWP